MKNKVNTLFICLLLIVFSSLVFTSCEWKSEEDEQIVVIDCDTSQVTLSGKVKPILVSNCYSCHSNQNASVAGGGTNLEEYSSLKNQADNGLLVGVINHNNGFSQMPKGAAKLSDCNISLIEAWINKGALND